MFVNERKRAFELILFHFSSPLFTWFFNLALETFLRFKRIIPLYRSAGCNPNSYLQEFSIQQGPYQSQKEVADPTIQLGHISWYFILELAKSVSEKRKKNSNFLIEIFHLIEFVSFRRRKKLMDIDLADHLSPMFTINELTGLPKKATNP